MAHVVLSIPDSLSMAGNLNPVILTTVSDISVSLTKNGSEIFTTSYSPDASGRIEFDLKDIVYRSLSFTIPQDNVVEQTGIVADFILTIENQQYPFTAIRCGVYQLADSPSNWLKAHFLTWQPMKKRVTYYSPEWLTYYAVSSSVVKLRAVFESSESTITLATLSAGKAYSLNLQYAHVCGLLSNRYPSYFEVWAEIGEFQSEKQQYFFSVPFSPDEDWFLFENSLGGLDTFRAYGSVELNADHDYRTAEVGDEIISYDTETKRIYKKNTGWLDNFERRWLLDFFPSIHKYIYSTSALRPILLTASTSTYSSVDPPSSYEFSYRYPSKSPYLNLIKNEESIPPDIQVPDLDAPGFSIPPRLAEYPRIPLDGGVLLPAFGSSATSPTVTTIDAIRIYLQQHLNFGSGGSPHAHSNLALLEKFTLSPEGVLLFNNKKIDADIESLSEYFLSKTQPDTAARLITFIEGIYAKAISIFENGLKSLDFASNLFSGSGFGIYKDESGQWHLEIDHVEIRKTLRALKLIIQEMEVEGGVRMQGSAIMLSDRVEDLGDVENAYRIYFDSKGGKISNQFKIGVQARCHRVNTTSELGIAYYWRVVKAIGTDYIDVYKNNVNTRTKIDLDTNEEITFPVEVDSGSSIPNAGDVIVGCGSIVDPDRMAYIITTTIGPDTPKTEEWSYVNDFRPSQKFNLSKLRTATKEIIQADQVLYRTRTKGLIPVSLPAVEWTVGTTAFYPEQYTYEGSTWLCLDNAVSSAPNTIDGNWLITVAKGDKGEDLYFTAISATKGAEFYVEDAPYNATLTANIFKGSENITDTLHPACFVWTRESENEPGDPTWNQLHNGIGRSLTLTLSDIIGITRFTVTIYSNSGELLSIQTFNI
ncbi:hypothetical protein MASR1M31_04690 [Porphyromonadaceae bacterium]